MNPFPLSTWPRRRLEMRRARISIAQANELIHRLETFYCVSKEFKTAVKRLRRSLKETHRELETEERANARGILTPVSVSALSKCGKDVEKKIEAENDLLDTLRFYEGQVASLLDRAAGITLDHARSLHAELLIIRGEVCGGSSDQFRPLTSSPYRGSESPSASSA
jgi:hypothetical protein